MKEVLQKAPEEMSYSTSGDKYGFYGIGSEIFRDHDKMMAEFKNVKIRLKEVLSELKNIEGGKIK